MIVTGKGIKALLIALVMIIVGIIALIVTFQLIILILPFVVIIFIIGYFFRRIIMAKEDLKKYKSIDL